MEKAFKGRAAIITGASSGLGRAIAQRLGAAGMEQWLVGRSSDGLKQTAALIADAGGAPTHCHVIDLEERGPLGRLVEQVGREHPHLFAVINNAGVMHPEPVLEVPIERCQTMFNVNVLAPIESSKAAVAVMRRRRLPGHIINISSIAGRMELGRVYGASKAALELIGGALRAELENDDIRLTTIVPGVFETQIMRYFEPETLQSVVQHAQALGKPLAGPGSERLVGSPDDVARTVEFVLQQPINLNLHEIVIRPAASVQY